MTHNCIDCNLKENCKDRKRMLKIPEFKCEERALQYYTEEEKKIIRKNWEKRA